MNSRIKVIHICDKFGVKGSSIHGVSRLFSWWFPRFDKDRYELKLVGLRKGGTAAETLEKEGIDVISLNKGKFDISTLWLIVALIKREKLDIIHLHGYGATVFGVVAAKLTNTKVVLHEHFVDPNIPAYQGWVDYLLCRFIDSGVSNCQAVKDFMVKKRHIPESKICVVFNGVPLEDFQRVNGNQIDEARKRWNLPEESKIVASIGRLDEQKGNIYFVKAANILLKKGYKLKFLLVGDGPLLKELIELCRSYNIENDVIFTGHQREISLIQSIIDIQVFPSLWEGTTLTIFEAMSVGLPIVSTDVDGLGEVLEHEKNSLVVRPADPEDMAGAIERIINSPEFGDKLAHNAKEESYKYDIQKTVDTLQEIYQKLVAQSN